MSQQCHNSPPTGCLFRGMRMCTSLHQLVIVSFNNFQCQVDEISQRIFDPAFINPNETRVYLKAASLVGSFLAHALQCYCEQSKHTLFPFILNVRVGAHPNISVTSWKN